ncbi:MAG: DUF1211 domain-containing protein, partial [Gammaproteobacteria bacterium]|nr:DUF1211 domain-containing protein [Gammaproteobacteria bacterium]
MDQLSKAFLESCRKDQGRVLRGENMTRIETFVDAAFAFSFTMLVISIDEIPRSAAELLELSQDIPAFMLSAAIIGSIWLAHSIWSRTFGLQDRLTVYLSLALVMLVLIFIYPIKLMCQLTISYLSGGSLGTPLSPMDVNDVSSLMIYFAIGLLALSLIIISLYQNTLRHQDELVLTDYEKYFCKRMSLAWVVVVATAILSIVIVLVAPQEVEWGGLIYFSLVVSIPT